MNQTDRRFEAAKQMLDGYLQAQLQLQRLQALSVSPEVDGPTGLTARCEKLQRCLNARRRRVYALLRRTELPATEFRVVVARYLQGKNWEQIVQEMDRTRRHVLRLHGLALRHLGATLLRDGAAGADGR